MSSNLYLIIQNVPPREKGIFVCFKLGISWVTRSVQNLAESRPEFVYHILECVQRNMMGMTANQKKLSREEIENMKQFNLENGGISKCTKII